MALDSRQQAGADSGDLSDAGAPGEKPEAWEPAWVLEVLERFYDRVFEDLMIGYLFRGKDRARLIAKEWEWTLRLFGDSRPYTGRGMREVHRGLGILRGHFDRRQTILEEVLKESRIPAGLQREWLQHNESLRSLILESESEQKPA
ncbi:MAG: group 1 truncated hemoglobin [Planctomycetota bacterium]|nr:MAG: group 1 truncated hemoglobin [Planctomycetota bacterium]